MEVMFPGKSPPGLDVPCPLNLNKGMSLPLTARYGMSRGMGTWVGRTSSWVIRSTVLSQSLASVDNSPGPRLSRALSWRSGGEPAPCVPALSSELHSEKKSCVQRAFHVDCLSSLILFFFISRQTYRVLRVAVKFQMGLIISDYKLTPHEFYLAAF